MARVTITSPASAHRDGAPLTSCTTSTDGEGIWDSASYMRHQFSRPAGAPGPLVIVTVSAAPTVGGSSGKSARTSPPMKPSVRSRTLNGSMALLIVGLSTPLRNARSFSLIGSVFDRSVIHSPHRLWRAARRRAAPALSLKRPAPDAY